MISILVAEAAAVARKAVTFPVGGSSPIGVLRYVAAAAELGAQLAERGVGGVRVVVPLGSGGTAAGFALGIALLDLPLTVEASCVGHPAAESRATLTRLANETAQLLGVEPPTLDPVRIDDGTLGPGYGLPTAQTWAALRLFGRTEGILLDPGYTGKAAAALVERAGRGEFGAGEQVVFVHTGRLPGLYGYGPEAAVAAAG